VMIRESPTKASKGGTSSMGGGGGGGAGGGAAISSFFDIFTEVTTDGGVTWGATTNGPTHMELQRIAPVYTFTNNLLPTLSGQYTCLPSWFAYYANGIVITNFVNRSFTAAITPPAPGLSTSHTFGSTVEFDVSYDGGLTYGHATAPATDTFQITARLGDDGVTEYYDTEMTQLSISGGSLPANVQIRESPTKASLGRTTSNAAGGGNYQIDSFFDIFTEVSTDAGMSWYQTVAGPMTVLLRPQALGVTCPSNITVWATSPAGAVVNYPAPTASGGCPPFTVTASPPSGSTFPIGTNTVTGTAIDGCAQTNTCAFTVIVRPYDSVGDGIPDQWRAQYFGGDGSTTNSLSCATCDRTGTGQNNRFKYTAGLDPTNPASVFVLKIASVTGQPNQKNLVFNPVASGRTYTTEYRTNLVTRLYMNLAGYSGPTTNGNEVTVTDLNALEKGKFYRIKISLP
jgi:hypothetical protein